MTRIKLKPSPEIEIRSVWANGEYITRDIESVTAPTEDLPYWRVVLKAGDDVLITGQVIVKRVFKKEPSEE